MSVATNLERIREQIAAACRRARRRESEVALMAVSKTHPADVMLEAYAAGQRLFGENRVQEMQAKHAQVAHLSGIELHLIGPLQSNKTARAAELFHAIDTVDSLKLAQRLNAAAATLDKKLSILIEVKLSHEESKHGLAPQELPGLLAALKDLNHLTPRGLMTIPPLTENPEDARPYFRQLRQLRDEAQRLHPTVTELSMGMSGDFAVAIEEGSTIIRVGTALFGQREYPAP
jgi:pyridoxal phosphate enzyme (YggS family)